MKSILRLMVLLAAAAFGTAAFATVSVDSMNYPVWVERNALTVPVGPGDPLLVGDVVRTGTTGRAWLSVEDGSVVKLGQDARLVIDRALFRSSGSETILDAAFDLVRGAFRFTSKFFPAVRPATHRVGFQVGAVTVGVRGTDIWGRSGDEEDFVALIEGQIEVSSDGEAPQTMDQALTLYRKREGLPADPVQSIELTAVQSLAPETELAVDAGIASTTGEYNLVLMSLQTSALVETSLERFLKSGFAAKTESVEVGGRAYTRILLPKLVDIAAAKYLRDIVEAEFSISDAWINKDE